MKVKIHASAAIAQPESSEGDKELGKITITLKDSSGKTIMTISGITLTLKARTN